MQSEISVFSKNEKSPPPLNMSLLSPILPPPKFKSRQTDPPSQPSFVATPHTIGRADLPSDEISDENFLASGKGISLCFLLILLSCSQTIFASDISNDAQQVKSKQTKVDQSKETKSQIMSAKSIHKEASIREANTFSGTEEKHVFNQGKQISTKPIKIVISNSEYTEKLDSEEEHLERRGKKRSTANLIAENKADKRLKTAREQEESDTREKTSQAHQDDEKVGMQNKQTSKITVRQDKDTEEAETEKSMDQAEEEHTVAYPIHDNYSVAMDNQEEEMEDNNDSGDEAPSRTRREHLESKSRGEKVTNNRKHSVQEEEEEDEEEIEAEFQEMEEEDEEYDEGQRRDQKKGKRRDVTEDNWQGADVSGEVLSGEEIEDQHRDDYKVLPLLSSRFLNHRTLVAFAMYTIHFSKSFSLCVGSRPTMESTSSESPLEPRATMPPRRIMAPPIYISDTYIYIVCSFKYPQAHL